MKTIVAILGLLAALGAQSAEPPVLTLRQAIALAENQNRELGAATARYDAANAGIDEARSFRLPRIELEGGFERTDNPVLVFSHLLAQQSFSAENFDIDKLNRPDPLNDWSTRLGFEQTLWAGGRLASLVESARHHRDAARAERERTRQQVVREVTEAYATAVLATHQLRVAQEALETAAAHVRLTDDLWQGGLVVESDLLSAQVRESELREILIRAESGIKISRAALNLVMGRDLGTPFSLPPSMLSEGSELPDFDSDDLAALVERARRRRPDLEARSHRRAVAESQVDVERASKRPQIGLRASYETHAEDFLNHDGNGWAITAGVRLPLFDGGRTRSRVGRAKAQVREAALRTELLEQEISLEVRISFHALNAARQRLDEAARSGELARRSLEIVEDRYKEGLTTLPHLLDAETALTRARLRQVTAHRDILLARAGLDLATGEL